MKTKAKNELLQNMQQLDSSEKDVLVALEKLGGELTMFSFSIMCVQVGCKPSQFIEKQLVDIDPSVYGLGATVILNHFGREFLKQNSQ